MASEAITLARKGIDAFNRADWPATRDLTADGVVYAELGTGRRTQGVDEFVGLAQAWKAAFPDAKGTVTRELESGDTAVVEVTWTGTHTGNLATPTGDRIPPTGKKISVPAVQIVQVRGGKITETRHYFDLTTMMVQLGLMPAMTRA